MGRYLSDQWCTLREREYKERQGLGNRDISSNCFFVFVSCRKKEEEEA